MLLLVYAVQALYARGCFLYYIGNKALMSLLSRESRATFLASCVLKKDSTRAMCVVMANWLVNAGSFKTGLVWGGHD
jgi:hypothetical protein